MSQLSGNSLKVFSIVMLVAISGCENTVQVNNAPVQVPEPPMQNVPAANTYRLLVSFNSFASGTDPVVVGKMEKLIADLEKELGRPVQKKTVHWGREGEFNYCFTLSEMNAAKQNVFVSKVKAELGSSDRAGIRENVECP